MKRCAEQSLPGYFAPTHLPILDDAHPYCFDIDCTLYGIDVAVPYGMVAAKNLCENRAKPILKCNGKCQLMKKLKQADKDEEKQTPQTIKEKLELLYCHNQANFNVSQKFDFEVKKQSFFGYKFQDYSSYQSTIFRPPIFNLI